jgi:hypothetical protein
LEDAEGHDVSDRRTHNTRRTADDRWTIYRAKATRTLSWKKTIVSAKGV